MFDSDRPSWQNPRVLAILVLVFLSGAAVGALTMRFSIQRSRAGASSSHGGVSLSYERLTKELNLSTEQCRQLKTILDDYARYRQDLQAQLDDWQATGKNQILRILDPGQRVRFEQMTEVK